MTLKRHARVIGKCLQTLGKLLYLDNTTIGFPLMPGTRESCQACIRLLSDTSSVTVCEQDMQDVHWEIRKEEVLHFFTWAISHVVTQSKSPVTFFALHKGGDKVLDKLGKGADDIFWSVPV